MNDDDVVQLTAEIVSAYVANNSVPAAQIGELISSVHTSLNTLGGNASAPVAAEKALPAVSIKKSVTPDFIVCLDDGKRFQSLKRHLTSLGMTPDEYRQKWNLSHDYPMVASNYSATRSALAKAIGLGRKPKAPEPVAEPAKPAKKARAKKTAPSTK